MDQTPARYLEYLKKSSPLGEIYRKFWLYPRIARHLGGETLDVGCGVGKFLRFRPGTLGVDINPAIVEFGLTQGLPITRMDPDRLPFPDSRFDAIVLDNVLEHVANPQPLLAEMRRVLKSQGRAVVGVPGRKGYAHDPDHKRFYDEQTLRATMEGAGFRTREIFYMPFKLRWLDRRLWIYACFGVFERTQ
jgi:SAM-dependent methyltransferase